MELIYFLIFLISCLIKDIDNVLLKKTDINAFKDEKILHVSQEPSLLQCAQRCRFIDNNSIVDFKNSKCTCVKYEVAEGQEQQGTLTGVFVNQKIMRAKKLEPPSRVINVALNKTAQQSTTFFDNPEYAANKSIDGLESTESATEFELNQWWSVDLGTTTDIMYMVLKGAYLLSTNLALIAETRQEESGVWMTCKDFGDSYHPNTLNFTCDNPTNARFVKIKSKVKCIIGFREFEVYARVTV